MIQLEKHVRSTIIIFLKVPTSGHVNIVIPVHIAVVCQPQLINPKVATVVKRLELKLTRSVLLKILEGATIILHFSDMI